MLIAPDEVIRALSIGLFGGLAGVSTVAFPGSALWLLPAGMAVAGCALTVPEIRSEVAGLLPAPERIQQLRGAISQASWGLPGIKRPEGLPGPARASQTEPPGQPGSTRASQQRQRKSLKSACGPLRIG